MSTQRNWWWVRTFVDESNRIEGLGPASAGEVEATELFLGLPQVRVDDLATLVRAYQPDARLRDTVGLDVRVGTHIAPRGGPEIRERLRWLLEHTIRVATPFEMHWAYETLHPFIDGNGRSGRALWAWRMERMPAAYDPHWRVRGFLHTWYYQSLEAGR